MKTAIEQLQHLLKYLAPLQKDVTHEKRRLESALSTKSMGNIQNRLTKKAERLSHLQKTIFNLKKQINAEILNWHTVKADDKSDTKDSNFSYDTSWCFNDDKTLLINTNGKAPWNSWDGFYGHGCKLSSDDFHGCDHLPDDEPIKQWEVECKIESLTHKINKKSWGSIAITARNNTKPNPDHIEKLKDCFGYNKEVSCISNGRQEGAAMAGITFGAIAFLISICLITYKTKKARLANRASHSSSPSPTERSHLLSTNQESYSNTAVSTLDSSLKTKPKAYQQRLEAIGLTYTEIKDDYILSEFIDPITLEVMDDPINATADGKYLDEKIYKELMKTTKIYPTSREPLLPNAKVNITFRNIIEKHIIKLEEEHRNKNASHVSSSMENTINPSAAIENQPSSPRP